MTKTQSALLATVALLALALCTKAPVVKAAPAGYYVLSNDDAPHGLAGRFVMALLFPK